jgi:hypothetical protein
LSVTQGRNDAFLASDAETKCHVLTQNTRSAKLSFLTRLEEQIQGDGGGKAINKNFC